MDDELEDTHGVCEWINSCYSDSGMTLYEFACAMKCSVKRLLEIMETGRMSERKWELFRGISREVYDVTDYEIW